METIRIAACILTDSYNRLLLLHRPMDDIGWWEIPGGKVEEGETPEATGIREMQEELGIRVAIEAKIGEGAFEYNGDNYHMTWLRATVVSGEPHPMEADMHDDLEYFDLEELSALSLSPGSQLFFEQVFDGTIQLN